tara:strand:- start:6566 stop:7603 length:1038 start_codon:yes stop_codon:yes gene_type:complete
MDEWSNEIIRQWDKQKIKNPFTMRTVTINSTTFKQIDEIIQLHNNNSFISGLMWDNNSCYMDCILMCLLVQPATWTKRFILNSNHDNSFKILLSTELNYLYRKIHSNTEKYSCKELRNIFNIYSPESIFTTYEQADSDEFLRYLFNIFDVGVKSTGIVMQELSWGKQYPTDKWDFISERIDRKATPIWNVEIFSIINKSDTKLYNISDFLKIKSIDRVDWSTYKKNKNFQFQLRKREIKIISSTFLCISIPRYNPFDEEKKITTKIVPVKYITIQENKLKLSSIIVHEGTQLEGHYYAFIEHNNIWYLYDDIINNGTPSLIGNYTALKEKYLETIAINGVLFFYL